MAGNRAPELSTKTALAASSPDSSASESTDENVLAAWRERVIDLRRLNWPLRLVIAATVLATGVAAALIILRDLPQPQLILNLNQEMPAVPIPTSAFVAAFGLWVVAWALALTGAIHGHWALRVVVVGVFVYTMLLAAIHNVFAIAFMAPLAIILLWVLAISALRWRSLRTSHPLPGWLPAVTFVVVLTCFAAHYAIFWAVVGRTDLVSTEFDIYSLVLVPILFFTGSDFAEWGEVAAGQLNSWLRRPRSSWLLMSVTVIVAVGILAYRLIQRGTFAPFDLPSAVDIAFVLLFGLITALLLLVVARLGRLATWPRFAIPAGAVVAATIVIMALLLGPSYLVIFIQSVTPDVPQVHNILLNIDLNIDPTGVLSLGLVPVLLGVLVGLPLLVRGRRHPGLLAVAGLFFVIFGLRNGLLLLPLILAQFGVPTNQLILFTLDPEHYLTLANIPVLNLPVLQIVTSFFTLVIIGWLVIRGGARSDWARDVIATLLLLNVGILFLVLLDQIFLATDQVAARFTAAQGVLLVLAFLWDLLTSGKQVTNTEGRQSPRFARVLLYAGVSLLSCSQVLFISTLVGSAGTNSNGDWTDTGLKVLGIPLLLTVILLRLAQAGAPRTGHESLPVRPMGSESDWQLPLTNVPGVYQAE